MFNRNNLVSLLNSQFLKYVNVRLINDESKKKVHRILHSAISAMDNQKWKNLYKKNKIDNQQPLRHVKYREKKGSLPAPGVIDLHVIGSGGPGTSKSVLLVTTNASYIFNCGEGTQRMANEKKLRLAKLENIFITNKSWENIGGLFGMCLTLEGFGVPVINLHGPPGIENITRESILYAEKSRVFIEKHRTWRKSFSDVNINVDYVPLLPEEREKHYRNCSDLTVEETNQPSAGDTETVESLSTNKETKVEDALTEDTEEGPPTKKKKFTIYSPVTDPKVTMAYIVKPHEQPGKVDINKCVELGLSKGPMIGRLKDGQSVTLDNGTVIQPEQILSEQEKSKPILIVECPSEDHLYSLLESKQISDCYHDEDNSAEIVVHMAPAAVVENAQYQMFIQRFPTSTIHLFLNEKTSNYSSQKAMQTQTWLNILHPTIFPKLHMMEPKTESSTEHKNHVIAKPFLRYSYRPKKGLHWDNCVETDDEIYRKEITDKKDVMKCITDFHSLLSTNQVHGSEKNYPEVAFLGTGSALPATSRNVTGILLNIDEETSLILDCGEGTAGQIYRTYGEQTDDVLSKIKVIFISHLHPDHHLGMIGILNARSAALARLGKPEEPILLCAPIQIRPWLNTNQEQFGVIREKLLLIPLQYLMKEPYKFTNFESTSYLIEKVTEKLNLKEFLPVPVIHNTHACGVSITHKSGWKIVFSGDTRPCKALVNTGTNCDLLIHEATLEDQFAADAVRKRHRLINLAPQANTLTEYISNSTTSEAVDIGIKMRAKFIILTHFSQRYPKIPVFENNYNYPIGLAFDCMKVKLSDVNILSDMISPLQVIFKEEIQFMKERSEKQDWKKRYIKERMETSSSSPTTETNSEECVDKQSSSVSDHGLNKQQSSSVSDHGLNKQSEEKHVLLKQTTTS